jgi:hypothetical protein
MPADSARSCGSSVATTGERGLDDSLVGRQRALGLDGVDSSFDDGRVPDAVRVEEGDDGVTTRSLGGLQRRPAFEEGSEDVRLLVPKPVEDLGEVVLEREGQTVRDADAVLDQVTSRLDEPPEGAHVVALATKRCELLRVTAQQIEGQRRVGRVVLGATRDEGTTVFGERARIHGEDDEELVLEQRRHDRPLGELEAHGDGATAEAFAELTCPGVNDSGTVFENGSLAIGRTRDLKQTSCLRSAQSMPMKAANSDACSCMGTSSI